MPADQRNATPSLSSIRKTQTARKTASAPHFPSLDRPSLSFGEFACYASDINNKDTIMFNINPYSDLARIVDTIFHYISRSQGYNHMADLDQDLACNLFKKPLKRTSKCTSKNQLTSYTAKTNSTNSPMSPLTSLLWNRRKSASQCAASGCFGVPDIQVRRCGPSGQIHCQQSHCSRCGTICHLCRHCEGLQPFQC